MLCSVLKVGHCVAFVAPFNSELWQTVSTLFFLSQLVSHLSFHFPTKKKKHKQLCLGISLISLFTWRWSNFAGMSWKYLFKQKVWPMKKSRYWLALIFPKLWAHLLQEPLTCWLTCRLLHAPSFKNVILKANYIHKSECNVLLIW